MTIVSREWAALLGGGGARGRIGRARFRSERAALRSDWRTLWDERAGIGKSHRRPHATAPTANPARHRPPASPRRPGPASIYLGPRGSVDTDTAGTVTILATTAIATEDTTDSGTFTITASPAPSSPLYVSFDVDG